MKNGFLEIGKVVNTHALRGELKVVPWCDNPQIFLGLGHVYIDSKPFDIESAKEHKGSILLKLKGVDSIEQAQELKDKNTILYVTRAQLGELPKDTYYIIDLIGLKVYEGDKFLGTIEDCFPTGGNDVYVVRSEDGRRILIPAIKQVVKKVDIENGRMDVELMEGMGDDN
ncbi:MAG: ribosome maturation factor RimM [Eubacteriales bacterium]|nr:ribosome maturation factor RimM [Eubacteriales bacterium]